MFSSVIRSVLSLHKALAPYAVGIVVEGSPTRMAELEDLRRLMSLEFKQSRIPVLPLNAPWTTAQCDARGMPYLIFLSDSTFEQGIYGHWFSIFNTFELNNHSLIIRTNFCVNKRYDTLRGIFI